MQLKFILKRGNKNLEKSMLIDEVKMMESNNSICRSFWLDGFFFRKSIDYTELSQLKKLLVIIS